MWITELLRDGANWWVAGASSRSASSECDESRSWGAACSPTVFFFFQAEDGIRDHCVTGVQTCALPIFLIYPSQYVAEEKRQIHEHVWEEGKTVRLGETGRQLGAVVFAWDAVKSGATDSADGKNVVIHEFAHQLDFENYATDGAPSLATREQQLSWREVMKAEFASLRIAGETGIPTLLDT